MSEKAAFVKQVAVEINETELGYYIFQSVDGVTVLRDGPYSDNETAEEVYKEMMSEAGINRAVAIAFRLASEMDET